MVEVECIGIIGVGLIGGSLALALKKNGKGKRFLGYDTEPQSVEKALSLGALDETCSSAAELATKSDLVIIATPVRAIPRVLEEIGPAVRPGTLVIDVGSTKTNIVQRAMELLPREVIFVGGHPMAGSEQHGIENADPDLFQNSTFVFTPTESCSAEVFSFLLQVFTSIGSRVIFMDPEAHDRAVSLISHLPHLLAFSLVNLLVEEGKRLEGVSRLASGGFRDMTRIASSNPHLWIDILLENREEVVSAIDKFMEFLKKGKECLVEGREGELLEFMQRARRGRVELTPALKTALAEMYTVTIPVENRPGIISEITLALGEKGINIEDLEIAHPLEDEKGLLRLMLRGEETARTAKEVLIARGFALGVEKTLGEA